MADRRVVDIGEVEETLKYEEEKKQKKEQFERAQKMCEDMPSEPTDDLYKLIDDTYKPMGDTHDPWTYTVSMPSPFVPKTFREMLEEAREQEHKR